MVGERAAAILRRVDSGRCSAAAGAGPQFVSEVFYGTDDTVGGNLGDSWCSMGRIALFDARGRKRVGDAAALSAFNASVALLSHDLLRGPEARQQPQPIRAPLRMRPLRGQPAVQLCSSLAGAVDA